MARVSLLFRTDVHVADRSPSSWKGDYTAEVLNSLEQIGLIADDHSVQAVLDGGDFFHVKTASRNSHGLIIQVAKIHAKYPCKVFCVEGNHDVSGNNLDTIEQQPLGVLYEAKVFYHLREEVFSDEDVEVRVVGVPYSPDRTLDELRSIQKRKRPISGGRREKLVAVVHALAGKNPPAHVEEFFGEPVFRYEDLITPDGPDVWCFGHWHQDQGIEEIDGRWFVNQGAVSRGALVRENLERTPKVAIIRVCDEDLSVLSVPLKVAPSSEVFDLERKERRDQEAKVIDQFVSVLGESVDFDPSVGIEENVQKLSFAADVRSLAVDYLTQAREQKKGRR